MSLLDLLLSIGVIVLLLSGHTSVERIRSGRQRSRARIARWQAEAAAILVGLRHAG